MTLTAERLRELLHYDPQTGAFVHRIGHAVVKRGDPAGYFDASRGYMRISVGNRMYFAHRLAWLYVYGEWPNGDLDHKDRNKTNNAITNLRVATNVQNQINRLSTNRLGLKGVTKRERSARPALYEAKISVAGVKRSLGLFDSPEEAHKVYRRECERLHGEFSCFDVRGA